MSRRALVLLSIVGAALFVGGLTFDLALVALLGVICLTPLLLVVSGVVAVMLLTAFVAALYGIGQVPWAIARGWEYLGEGLDRAAGWIGESFNAAARWLAKRPAVATAGSFALVASAALAAAETRTAPPSNDAGTVVGAAVVRGAPAERSPADGGPVAPRVDDRAASPASPAMTGDVTTETDEPAPATPPSSKGMVRALGER